MNTKSNLTILLQIQKLNGIHFNKKQGFVTQFHGDDTRFISCNEW